MTIKHRSSNSLAAAGMCFSKGLKSTEADMQPDLDLVYEMLDRKIRVQDLIEDAVAFAAGGSYGQSVDDFLRWYCMRGVQTSKIDVSDEIKRPKWCSICCQDGHDEKDCCIKTIPTAPHSVADCYWCGKGGFKTEEERKEHTSRCY